MKKIFTAIIWFLIGLLVGSMLFYDSYGHYYNLEWWVESERSCLLWWMPKDDGGGIGKQLFCIKNLK